MVVAGEEAQAYRHDDDPRARGRGSLTDLIVVADSWYRSAPKLRSSPKAVHTHRDERIPLYSFAQPPGRAHMARRLHSRRLTASDSSSRTGTSGRHQKIRHPGL